MHYVVHFQCSVSGVHPILLLSSVLWHGYTIVCVHSSVDQHFNCLQLGAIMNNTLNIQIKIFLWTHIFIFKYPRVDWVGHVKSLFNLKDNAILFFQVTAQFCILSSSEGGFWLLHTAVNA